MSTTDKSIIDYSNVSDGYIMLQYLGKQARLILWITGPSGNRYQYQPGSLSSFQAFPLTDGNGKYTIEFFEGAANSTAVSPVDRIEVNVSINNSFSPFLMPSYEVNYTSGSAAVSKGSEVSAGATTEVEKVEKIYNWIIGNLTYDYDKAKTVQPGYVPNVEEIMKIKKGVCYDYSAVAAAMLRSQGIPTKLEVGYAGSIYHAWISVYTKDAGWVNGWIQFDGNKFRLIDITNASVNGDNNKGFQSFMNNTGNYQTLFHY